MVIFDRSRRVSGVLYALREQSRVDIIEKQIMIAVQNRAFCFLVVRNAVHADTSILLSASTHVIVYSQLQETFARKYRFTFHE